MGNSNLKKRKGLVEKLTYELELLSNQEETGDNLVCTMEVKLHMNMEIKKKRRPFGSNVFV